MSWFDSFEIPLLHSSIAINCVNFKDVEKIAYSLQYADAITKGKQNIHKILV